jgi:hypothetical protein
METIAFNADDHTYEKEGKRVPSVTQVLPEIPEHLLYKQFFINKTLLGSRVHEYCELINKTIQNGTSISSLVFDVPESDKPYLAAYMSFVDRDLVKVYETEKKMFHPIYNYAGTLDIVAETRSFGKAIVDIKCVSTMSPSTCLQTAAYLKAYNYKRKKKIYKRAAIQLKPDGTYEIYKFPVKQLKTDFDIFLCKLKSYQWDLDNGMRK